jgi:amidase
VGAVLEIAETLRSLGHEVIERELDYGVGPGNHAVARYLRGIRSEVAGVPHPEKLEKRTRGFARLARSVPDWQLRGAVKKEEADRARLGEIYEHCDVVLTPVTGTPPVEVGRWEGQGALRTLLGMSRVYPFGAIWNHTGQPAAAIPAGRVGDNLPVAALLVGRPNDEETLLSLSAQLEAERRWFDDRPPGM